MYHTYIHIEFKGDMPKRHQVESVLHELDLTGIGERFSWFPDKMTWHYDYEGPELIDADEEFYDKLLPYVEVIDHVIYQSTDVYYYNKREE